MAPDAIAEDVRDLVQDSMESHRILSVPLLADANIGKTWSEAK